MQVAFTVQEVKMKYLILGLVVTLVLTTFVFASISKAVFVELKEWLGKGRFDRRD